MTVHFKTEQIEELLSQESYSPVKRVDKSILTLEEKQEMNALERLNSFGHDSITLFEDMIEEMGTLPSQALYVDRGLPMMIAHLQEYKPEVSITDVARKSLILRMTRTYMSKVVELHLGCIFEEYLPELTIRNYSIIDSVMGVDFVAEDDTKRYYIHVTSNTPFAQRMLQKKEARGGYKVGNTYQRYSRDFTGDLILKYDTYCDSDTTAIVNGFPLFKPDFIQDRFFIAKRQSKIGEPLAVPYSKLQHFKDWAETYMDKDIQSI